MSYQDEIQKPASVVCFGCASCAVGGDTTEEVETIALALEWFKVVAADGEVRWYCSAHPDPSKPRGPAMRGMK